MMFLNLSIVSTVLSIAACQFQRMTLPGRFPRVGGFMPNPRRTNMNRMQIGNRFMPRSIPPWFRSPRFPEGRGINNRPNGGSDVSRNRFDPPQRTRQMSPSSQPNSPRAFSNNMGSRFNHAETMQRDPQTPHDSPGFFGNRERQSAQEVLGNRESHSRGSQFNRPPNQPEFSGRGRMGEQIRPNSQRFFGNTDQQGKPQAFDNRESQPNRFPFNSPLSQIDGQERNAPKTSRSFGMRPPNRPNLGNEPRVSQNHDPPIRDIDIVDPSSQQRFPVLDMEGGTNLHLLENSGPANRQSYDTTRDTSKTNTNQPKSSWNTKPPVAQKTFYEPTRGNELPGLPLKNTPEGWGNPNSNPSSRNVRPSETVEQPFQNNARDFGGRNSPGNHGRTDFVEPASSATANQQHQNTGKDFGGRNAPGNHGRTNSGGSASSDMQHDQWSKIIPPSSSRGNGAFSSGQGGTNQTPAGGQGSNSLSQLVQFGALDPSDAMLLAGMQSGGNGNTNVQNVVQASVLADIDMQDLVRFSQLGVTGLGF